MFFSFFLLFVLRVVLRSQWIAASAFAGIFAILSLMGDDHPVTSALVALLYFGTGAVLVLRSGLLSYAVAIFVSELLLKLPTTRDTSAWYFGNMLLLLAVIVALVSWAFYLAAPRTARTGVPARVPAN